MPGSEATTLYQKTLVNTFDSLSLLPYRSALQIPTFEHQVRGISLLSEGA